MWDVEVGTRAGHCLLLEFLGVAVTLVYLVDLFKRSELDFEELLRRI